jgi:hypothetical protein
MQYHSSSANYAFVVKESSNLKGWQIMLEPRNGELPVLADGFLMLVLEDSISEQAARALAKDLNQKVRVVSHTHSAEGVSSTIGR